MIIFLFFTFYGCDGLGVENTQGETPPDTVIPKETIPLIPYQSNSQNYDEDYILSSKNTLYNRISEIPDHLPTRELCETLVSYGIDPNVSAQDFKTDLLGRYYYSVDLSCLEPLCYTTENELICTIKGDDNPVMLIVLDSPVPTAGRFYPTTAWDLASCQPTFLADGVAATGQQEECCKELFLIHTQATGLKQAAILDGYPSVETITVQFNECRGITYTFFVYHYPSLDEDVIYSVRDGHQVYCSPCQGDGSVS